jgi:ABC-type branched-subunit amino acid transport system substrate-binding protein
MRGNRHGKFFFIIACFFLLAAACFLQVASAALSLQEERGKQIYFNGTSPSGGKITAYFGKDLLEIPGDGATCASCHGYDGLGRPESGVTPSNVTWTYLMKPYGHIHPDGFEHDAFSIESLKRYMKEGFYPGEKRGDPSMPIYALSDQDLDDLMAFLRVLDQRLDPGLSNTTVRVGIMYSGEGRLQETGRAMEHIVSAYFNRLNEQGGIYGRKIEVVPVTISGAAEAGPGSLTAAIAKNDLFALVSPFLPGRDRDLSVAAEQEGIPVVGPYTFSPLEGTALNRSIFYIFSGLGENLLALVDFASTEKELISRAALLLVPAGSSLKDMKLLIEERVKKRGWKDVIAVEYGESGIDPDSIAGKLKGHNAGMVLLMGGEREFRSLAAAVEKSGWKGRILVPGVLVGGALNDVSEELRSQLAIAYPTLPLDRKEEGAQDLMLLSQGVAGSPFEVSRVLAYASAKLLAEGLGRSGKALSRTGLISSLEHISAFKTGLTPELGFSQNQRIGAFGAYVVFFTRDQGEGKGLQASQRWISLE